MNIILPFESFPLLYESRTRTLKNGQKYRIIMYRNGRQRIIGFYVKDYNDGWCVSHSIGVTKNDLKRMLEC